ncbi:MAG TPA: type IV pilus assembly protein PilM [Phycisphaerae bacterium]|nr:type IV pilus assembly protein PilM [Phycisphaerae bacterium]
MAGAQSAWGIDIGTMSLKAIKLRKDGDRVQVEAFDVIDHDQPLSDPTINRDEIIRRSLTRFLDRHTTRRDAVFVSVPGSMAFSRFVKLPPVEPKKVPEIVRFEAIQQIPFPLDQVNWDFYKFQAPDSPDVEVGIFAMKKDLVEEVLANFTAVGMSVQGVQLSPLAVYNAAAYDDMSNGKGAVIVDMGADHTDLVVVERGMIWMRSINIGGSHFTDALSKSFKRPFDKAEELKKNALQSKYQKQIFQAMRPVFADLVADIQRSIGHYSSSHRDSRLDVVVGMGNPFRLPNLQKYLQQELKMDVVRLDQFKRVNADSKTAAALNDNILSLPAAYGLAIQGLGLAEIDTNLLPVEIARKMMWKSKQPWFIAATALIVLGVASLGAKYYSASGAFDKMEKSDTAVSNDAALGKFSAAKQKYNALGDSVKASQETAENFVKLAEYRALWPMLTMDILDSLPQAHAAAGAGPSSQPAPLNIVLTRIDPVFSANLSGVSLTGGPATPAPANANTNTNNANNNAQTGAVADSNRGFIVTINGYTTAPEGWKVIKSQFEDVLMDKAKHVAANSKPYYFLPEEVYSPGQVIPRPTPGANPTGMGATGVTTPWGGTGAHGSYWEFFVPDLAGVHPTTAPAAAAPGGLGAVMNAAQARDLPGPVDAFLSTRDSASTPLLYDAYTFTFVFKVHVK